jgi:hypothetical protein
MKKILIIIVAVVAMFLFHNCNSSTELQDENILGNDFNLNNISNTGKFRVLLTAGGSSKSSYLAGIYSNNKENVINLFVTIQNLKVHRTSDSNAGWISLPIETGTYDLIALDTKAWSEIISNTEITTGYYNKIRFEVTDAQVTTESGTYDVKIPSGIIKIGIPFTVFEDCTTEITIEIDPEASLKITGNKKNPKYMLSPVFHIKSVDEDEVEDDDDDEEEDD